MTGPNWGAPSAQIGAMPLPAGSKAVNSAASTNQTLVKGTPGRIVSIVCSNVNAATRYVKLFDKATAPVTGTDTPILTIQVLTGATVGIVVGYTTLLGIGLAITVNATDLDNTNVAAGDVKVLLSYQ